MLPSIKKVAPWKRLGKVALGKRAEKGNPIDLDYFIFKEKNRDAKYDVSKKFHDRLGETPRELNIILPYPTLEETLRDRAVMYGGNGLRQCYTDDGVRATRRRKVGEKMEWFEMACPAEQCEYRAAKKCKEKAIFTFMVPAASEEVGTFYMDFGSRVAAQNIYSALVAIEEVCREQGRAQGLFGIRCKMVREPTAFDVDGRRIIKHIPTIHIDFASLMQRDQLLLGPLMGMVLPKREVLAITAAEVEAVEADHE